MPQRLDPLPFQIDHVIARMHGGPSRSKNLALSCYACNHHKGPNLSGRDPKTGRVVRLFDPRRQIWAEHFVWSGPRLMGLTPTGCATAMVLAVNLLHRVALRAALLELGEWPPRSS